MRWIATNAGHEGSIVVQKVQDMKDEEGFNAQTETYENLVRAGGDRSGQGGPLRTATRGVDRVVAAHDRSGHHADSGREHARGDAGRRHGRRPVLRRSVITDVEHLSHAGRRGCTATKR